MTVPKKMRGIVCAVALVAFACGGGDDDMRGLSKLPLQDYGATTTFAPTTSLNTVIRVFLAGLSEPDSLQLTLSLFQAAVPSGQIFPRATGSAWWLVEWGSGASGNHALWVDATRPVSIPLHAATVTVSIFFYAAPSEKLTARASLAYGSHSNASPLPTFTYPLSSPVNPGTATGFILPPFARNATVFLKEAAGSADVQVMDGANVILDTVPIVAGATSIPLPGNASRLNILNTAVAAIHLLSSFGVAP